MPSVSVTEIASLVDGIVDGDGSHLISGANSISDASLSDLSFVSGKATLQKERALALASKAGCLIVPLVFEASGPWSLIRVPEPRTAFATALNLIYPAKRFAAFIHPSAVISRTASVGSNVHIGAHVSIGDGCNIASGCVIRNGCFLGENVRLGENSLLHPNVSVYDAVQIGSHVIIHSNSVIGADGFGFVFTAGHYQKFPQVGTVVIEDNVEIGASCCIDRAALGVTRIGHGTKLDNLIHIAHNCVIGENVVIAAQAGFAGGVTIDDYAIVGGQTGIGEKAHIESHAIIGSKAGILSSATVHRGEPVWGIPARPLRGHLKGLANVNRLPELREQVRQLGQRIQELEKQQKRD